MKKTSIFINAARGAIHNETDLKDALEKGIIWGAGLDVTNPEPMSPGSSLLSMPNVCVLPHIGSATEETRGRNVIDCRKKYCCRVKRGKVAICCESGSLRLN